MFRPARLLRSSRRRPPAAPAEALERRLVLAGNVEAFASGGNIFLLGDDLGQQISVAAADPAGGANRFAVREFGGGTVNGGESPVTLTLGAGGVFVVLTGGGDDGLLLGDDRGLTLAGSLYVGTGPGADAVVTGGPFAASGYVAAITGRGNDVVTLTRAAAAEFYVYTEADADVVSLSNVAAPGSRTDPAAGAAVVALGAGDDRLTATNFAADGGAFVYGEDGDDRIELTGGRFGLRGAAGDGLVVAGGGLGVDRVTLSNLTVGPLLYVAAGGQAGFADDVIAVSNVDVSGSAVFALGGGDDRLELFGNTYGVARTAYGEGGFDTLLDRDPDADAAFTNFGFEELA